MQENQIENDKIENTKTAFDMGGLKLAFFGLLFTAINVRIQGFDIVPDFIGYLMVIVGLRRIEQYEANYTTARKLAIVLTMLALINIYQAPIQNTVDQFGMTESSPINFSAGIFGAVPLLATAFMIIGIIINIYFIYSMCMGTKNLLNQVGDFTLAKICDDRWRFILSAEIGLLFSLLLAMIQIPFGAILAMLFGVLFLVALVLFLLLIHHGYRSIHGKFIQERNSNDYHGE